MTTATSVRMGIRADIHPDSTPQPFWPVQVGFSNLRAVRAIAGGRVRNGPVPDHKVAHDAPSALAPNSSGNRVNLTH